MAKSGPEERVFCSPIAERDIPALADYPWTFSSRIPSLLPHSDPLRAIKLTPFPADGEGITSNPCSWIRIPVLPARFPWGGRKFAELSPSPLAVQNYRTSTIGSNFLDAELPSQYIHRTQKRVLINLCSSCQIL